MAGTGEVEIPGCDWAPSCPRHRDGDCRSSRLDRSCRGGRRWEGGSPRRGGGLVDGGYGGAVGVMKEKREEKGSDV
ncbi:hypothetical protein EUGRSUZ_I00373 [Eucalyptus grandis]|uniref:Uncharacterized protein n=2 Tax=Eucalyptus grandis TaxID=71139 RepID=A0ACC3JD57_EUCGR|nr:hypothetical protein EUGRSUZ_I00373 [Eucalyptus grandis]